ncbi:MAG: EutN/CcmL family microcompartment protein [Elusimicrobia bacterium]|nr:EutN/CcmL family microcompartment protein [Elusimicrobiota bacterium]MDA8244950.1 EutN/CcmL family microcompartment protein [Elusimicrobiota bacterium]
MKQAKVIGRVFCSRQCCGMEQKTLLLIQPLDWETDKPSGEPLVAGDTVGSGAGEKVFFVASREAIVAFEGWEGETATGTPLPPVDAAIVGIIDGKNIR